jgi:hypothetical protein
MSGSPVYIDGRLVGAVSYSLGQFATEADCRHHADRRDARRRDAADAAAQAARVDLPIPFTQRLCARP